MNLTTILAALGMGDGQGNTSSTRVILILAALAVLVPKFIAAFKGTPVAFDDADLKMLALILGGGIAKTVAEGKTDQTKPT
jgi:hypothetical protein